MRKRWIALPVVLAAAAYWTWPYAGAYTIAKAVERRDADAVAAHIDAPALKKSLVRQVVRAYLRESGRGEKLGAIGRGMAVSVGTTVADPYLSQLLSPAALTALLADGHVAPVTIDNRTLSFDQTLPSLPSALGGNIGAVLLGSSFESPATFLLHVPGGQGDAEGYGIELALEGLTWKVAGLTLPGPLLDRIAADIVSREKDKQAS